MRSARFIFPLRGKTVAKRPVGGKYGDKLRPIPGLSIMNSNKFNTLQIRRARPSDALKPAA